MNTALFKNRIEVFQNKSTKLKKLSRQFSIYRLLLFLMGIGVTYLLYLSFSILIAAIFGSICILIFIWLIKHHEVIKNHQKQYEILVKINENEINRSEYQLDMLDTGSEFLEQNHPYINDLDVFGENSLFQLINRTGTFIGKTQLANWLKKHHSITETVSFQTAIEELAPQLAWRQRFEAYGKNLEDNNYGLDQLEGWLRDKDDTVFDRRFIILTYSMPILTILSIVVRIENLVPTIIPILFITLNFFLLFRKRKYIFQLKANTSNNVSRLNSYLKLFKYIEKQKFKSPLLQNLQKDLIQKNISASKAITTFFKCLNSLDMSNNPVWAFIGNGVLLWDLRQAILLYFWKKDYSESIKIWLDTLSKIDALSSFAGFNYLHNSWTLPILNNKVYGIQATHVGHPLLPPKQRVSNPVLLNEKGVIHVITGSNMSGKSTYLRTVGINLLLAQLGLRVCAKSFECSSMRIFSSMRTHDSLKQNTSAFYAELLRLKDLIELVKKDGKTIFLLDEVLKGTNSKDRYQGAKSLINQLSKLNGIGFVSTHDLELSKLAETTQKIKNFSFNSEIKGSEIIFDYQLTEGICSSFNASQLMRNIGIDID